MRKLIAFVVCFMVVSTGICYAGGRVDTVFNNTEISTTTTITSRSFLVSNTSTFTCWMKLSHPTVVGTSEINIVRQLSYDDTAANYATPITVLAYTLNGTTPTVIEFITPGMQYLRFKAYGTANNTTGTTILMKLFSRD